MCMCCCVCICVYMSVYICVYLYVSTFLKKREKSKQSGTVVCGVRLDLRQSNYKLVA